MKSPEEKKDELIDKILQVILPLDGEGTLDYDSATKCSIICVEEIIKSLSPKGFPNESYWNQVLNLLKK